jgi:hypothetical protein
MPSWGGIMRSRCYTWKSQRLDPPVEWNIVVYADRSVEMFMTKVYSSREIVRRPTHFQTREEAAWMLIMARDNYTIEKTWL